MSSSPVTSPTQSPAPSPVTSLSNVCTGLSPLPVLTQFPRPGGPAQGDGRYSLLGQPLQYNLSICPPLLHGQSAYSVHQVRVSPISLRATGVSFSSRPLLLSHHLNQLGGQGRQSREHGRSGGSLCPTPVLILLTPSQCQLGGALYFSLATLWPV